jgi:hypothetical protein
MNYIASLTTYPLRFPSALIALQSIVRQTVEPDQIIVNVYEGDWEEAENNFIKKAKSISQNILIEKCSDLRPGNKIIPTAKKYKDNLIITFDDDVIYPKNRAKVLIDKHLIYPNNPILYRTRFVKFNGTETAPYQEWPLCQGENAPHSLHFPTGVSGALYPPNFFNLAFFDEEEYKALSHEGDDLWIYFHTLLQGSAVVKASNDPSTESVPESQSFALWKNNIHRNDLMIKLLESRYGRIFDLVNK